MKFFALLFLIILLIIFLEKPRLLGDIINNIKTIRGFVLNIIYILPFLAIFFNIDEFSDWINRKTNQHYGFNSQNQNQNQNKNQKWWHEPNARKKYKAKQLRKVSESTKKVVASNQHWRCFMCHKLLDYSYEIDHNTPLFLGGTNHISNLHALCRNCHGKKTILEKINM